MYQERVRYLEYRRKKWAAGVIAISWIMHVKMSKVRKHLNATRLDKIEAFKRRAKVSHLQAMCQDQIEAFKRRAKVNHLQAMCLDQIEAFRRRAKVIGLPPMLYQRCMSAGILIIKSEFRFVPFSINFIRYYLRGHFARNIIICMGKRHC